jgi:hypothetical protein
MEEGLSEKSRTEAVEERKASKDDAKAKRNKKRQVADKARQAEMKGRMAEEEMQKIRSVQTMTKSKKAFKCKQEAEAKEKAKAIMAARKARTSNADDRRLATTEEKVAKAAKMGAPKKVKEKQAFYKAAEAAQAEKTRADCAARHALAEARRKAAHGDRAAKAADMGQSQPMNLVEKEEARVAQTQCDEAADTKAFEEAKKAALKARHAGATMGPEPSVDTSRAQKTKSAAAPADPIEDYALGDSNALLAAVEEVESEAPEDVEDVGETEQEAVAKIVWGNDKEDRPDYVNFLKGQVELLQLKEGEQILKVLKLIAFQEWQRQKLAEANAEVLQERRAAEAAKGEVKTSQARIAQLERYSILQHKSLVGMGGREIPLVTVHSHDYFPPPFPPSFCLNLLVTSLLPWPPSRPTRCAHPTRRCSRGCCWPKPMLKCSKSDARQRRPRAK